MKELNYHPNLNARSLVSSYTQVIGLVLPDDSDAFYQNPFFPSVLRGIAQVASENHYAIQIATGKDEKERLKAISQMVYGKRVDGLIFLYAEEEDPLVKLVADEQFPFLILGNPFHPSSLLSIMTMSKLVLMQPNILSKKAANELPSLEGLSDSS